MRVAIVGIRFDNRGGSERRAMHLARGLARRGHELEIFANSIADTEGLDTAEHLVPSSGLSSYHRLKSFTQNAGRMLSGRTDIDIIHNQIRPFVKGIVSVGGGCHAAYLERRAAVSNPLKRAGFRLNPFHRYVLGLEKKMYSSDGCPAVITNSAMAREDILKHYDYPSNRVHVAYNGVDTGKFTPHPDKSARDSFRAGLGIGEEDVAVLFVGSDFWRKGLGTLIEAMRGLKGYRLVVVGRGDEKEYGSMAAAAGLESPVFTGTVPDALEYYRAADIYALPTMYDPFANTTLEAMACGLPVITTSHNGVSEIISHGTDGFVIEEPRDAGAVKNLLDTLSSGTKRAEIGAAARDRVSMLTWENTLNRTLEVYEAVLSGRY